MPDLTSLQRRVEELERQLDDAEQTIAALAPGEIDAVARADGTTPVLLHAAQESLRESQYFLEQAQVVGRLGCWMSPVELDGNLSWSREMYRITGIAEGTPIPVQRFFDLVHPADLDLQGVPATHRPRAGGADDAAPRARRRWEPDRPPGRGRRAGADGDAIHPTEARVQRARSAERRARRCSSGSSSAPTSTSCSRTWSCPG